MKPNVRLFTAIRGLVLPIYLSLSILAAVSSVRGQTGVYELDGGASTQDDQKYAATIAAQSGVYVFNTGELTLIEPTITKTGDSIDPTQSSQYGVNAGVLANTAGKVTINGGIITTNASYADGLCATGVGSYVGMTDGTITTTGVDAAGISLTYSATAELNNVNVTTQLISSPALGMDFGGGTYGITGGTFVTNGGASPDLYSIGTISVANATLTAHESPGAIINGPNAIYLSNCLLTGLTYGVELEQTSASSGTASLTVDGGTLTALAGDLVFLGPQSGALTADIVFEGGATVSTSTGNLVHATSHSTANFLADAETLAGSLVTDDSSTIAAVLQDGTSFTGKVNPQGSGTDGLAIDGNSTWNVKGASHLSSLINDGTMAFTSDGLAVDVSGAYHQASTGKLVVILDGTSAGTTYDQVTVGGKAALAGTLEVNTAGGFTPKIGETFDLITYGKEAGSFATLTSNSGLSFTIAYGAKAATITITGTATSKKRPTITTQPKSVAADPGAGVTFSVVAAGSGTLTYQWFRDGVEISGATSASYTIAKAATPDVGTYRVLVKNPAGRIASFAVTLALKATTVPTPVVSIGVLGDGEIVEGGEDGKVLFSRTGGLGGQLTVFYTTKGSAVNGADYVGTNGTALPGKIVIPAGTRSVNLKVKATGGAKTSSLEQVTLVLTDSPNANYALGSVNKAKLQLIDSQ
jgi:hypothetical protein